MHGSRRLQTGPGKMALFRTGRDDRGGSTICQGKSGPWQAWSTNLQWGYGGRAPSRIHGQSHPKAENLLFIFIQEGPKVKYVNKTIYAQQRYFTGFVQRRPAPTDDHLGTGGNHLVRKYLNPPMQAEKSRSLLHCDKSIKGYIQSSKFLCKTGAFELEEMKDHLTSSFWKMALKCSLWESQFGFGPG